MMESEKEFDVIHIHIQLATSSYEQRLVFLCCFVRFMHTCDTLCHSMEQKKTLMIDTQEYVEYDIKNMLISN